MPGPATPPLLTALKRVLKGLQREASGRLGGEGVLWGQWYVLEQLWDEDGLTVGALAERIGIEVPTAVRSVQRIEASGLVHRGRDVSDRRRVRVWLTDRGRSAEPAVRDALHELDLLAHRGLDARERAELLRLLAIVAGNLDNR